MNKEKGIYYSISDVCGGSSPWKSSLEVTRVTLRLANKGINVAGLTEKEVLRLHEEDLAGLRPMTSGDSLSTATATSNGTPTV